MENETPQSNRPWIIVGSIIILIILLGVGYYFLSQSTPEADDTTDITPTATISTSSTPTAIATTTPTTAATATLTSNKFSIKTAKVGDKVAGMTVSAVDPNHASGEGTTSFTGETTVTGKYTYHDEGIMQDEVCLEDLDAKSLTKIPYATEDTRIVWFCFSNTSVAQSAFSPKGATGTATVTINNYVVKYLGTETWNTAELKTVVSKK